LLTWGLAGGFFLLTDLFFGTTIYELGSGALTSFDLLIGNLMGWMYLLYPTETLRPGWLNVRRSLIQLLPMCALVGLNYLLPVDLRPLIALFPAALGIMLLFHIRAYRQWCEENYSSMENIDVQWIWRYIIMYLIIGGTYCVMSWSYNAAHAFTEQWLLLFMLSYSTEQILFRPDPWAEVKSRRPQPPEPEEAAADDPSEMPNAAYRETLEAWMQSERPYLNPEFRLMDMRQVLPLNRTYLSQLINTEYGCNFYQFVTNYRIDEAKRLMRENPDMKIQDISEQCGFSSPTVFARVFARETGMLPREWMQKSDNS
jgi:AraC-like DNA-binding protein